MQQRVTGTCMHAAGVYHEVEFYCLLGCFKAIPEHASPARGGPDGVGQNRVHPCSHEERVQDVGLKLGALGNGSRHNGASRSRELHSNRLLSPNFQAFAFQAWHVMWAHDDDACSLCQGVSNGA